MIPSDESAIRDLEHRFNAAWNAHDPDDLSESLMDDAQFITVNGAWTTSRDGFRDLMQRVYPETPLVELPFSHDIFRRPNAFPNGAPKVHEHDGGPARVFAIVRSGRLAVLYTFDCDIGNGIEDAGVHDDPVEKREAAMRFAINIATYAVTH